MKLIRLTEEQFQQFESIIGEIPTKWGNPLVAIYAPVTTTEEDPKPIGGGGGGPVKPPKES